MQEYKPFKSGKVREMYDVGDSIICLLYTSRKQLYIAVKT